MSIVVRNLSIMDSTNSFTYRDLNFNHFDSNRTQLAIDDLDSIRGSIQNLFIIKKGTRVRDPDFGSNLDEYMFQSVTEENARFLGEDIEEILLQESRILVRDIIVDMDVVNSTFNVGIVFVVPEISREAVALQLNIGENIGLELSNLRVNETDSRNRF